MSEVIKGTGEYKSKKSGEMVQYEYEYVSFDSLDEMTGDIGEEKVFKNAQRMLKVDASNTARESAKVQNGDSTRKPLTEAEKAANKAERATNKALLDKIKALSPSQRSALGL